MLSTIERRHEIVLLTEKHGNVAVKQLAEQFQISTVTIRHDLNELHKLGLIVRSRGGAVPSNRLTKELSIKEKHKENYKTKLLLGKAVADLIQDGDAIILDSGTTTELVAQNLIEKQNLTVMTNGLNIANELSRTDNCDVYISGGKLRRKSMSFYGSQAEQKLKLYNFNKVILAVDGIDLSSGISTHHEPEANFNRAMCDSAEQIIVVTDSSKFGRRSLHAILPLKAIDILVTDTGISQEFRDELETLSVTLIMVEQG
ncbi:transcriptional repressor AgaR [Thalassotalea sp. ND16A]|uniref:transcriptional repressor AgaR n=1 Tax=Thalassotalea sp. ND16A TaxID=1535422 RepID=UPI000519F05C|nr:transcriptional repressor AgaR [Thalassotalea sp. ND16A]KGJ91052.1 putative transcriptional regulator [Thalassotalea sp. ND16A]